jgi:exodeoxyribonuclease VII large subunit
MNWTAHEKNWRSLAERLLRVRPELAVQKWRERLAQLSQRLREQAARRREQSSQRVECLKDRWRLLGPENVLARGYSITQDTRTGKVVRSPKEVKTGQALCTRVAGGEIESTVD